MDEGRLRVALEGLDRLAEDPLALRAREFLEVAVHHSTNRGTRWTEQMCYALREALESIPPLFGQPRGQEPVGQVTLPLLDRIEAAIDVSERPESIKPAVSELRDALRMPETTRAERVAQAMLVQAGGGMRTPQIDAFAREWVEVVQGVNQILHGKEDHSEDEAMGWRDRAIGLVAVLVGPMSTRLDEIDGFLAMTSPMDDDARRLVHLLADSRLARHFFLRADSVAWLRVLEREGVFKPPMRGDWYQGDFLVRVSAQELDLARSIAVGIVGDPHPAAVLVALGVARELGPSATPLALRALRAAKNADGFALAREVEDLVEKWSATSETDTVHELADLVLQPQAGEGRWGLRSNFGDYEFARLVRIFVNGVHCDHVVSLGEKLVLKLKNATRLAGGDFALSFARDFISSDDARDWDVGNALISGVRDVLRRMRDCGVDLVVREALLRPLESEVFVRIWADHLAEEEENAP